MNIHLLINPFNYTAHSDQEEEGDVPMAQRKRFTRVEMARVLMERNQVNYNFAISSIINAEINYRFECKTNCEWHLLNC